ncbi:hypothetical protein BDW60DRAFT_209021 [Aspergillus nidulans var. acristatus]
MAKPADCARAEMKIVALPQVPTPYRDDRRRQAALQEYRMTGRLTPIVSV